MMFKKFRQLPDHVVYRDGFNVYGRMGKIVIRNSVVSLSQHMPCDNNAPKYSDADLELLIAKLKVAKESILDDIDKHIAILREVLRREAR